MAKGLHQAASMEHLYLYYVLFCRGNPFEEESLPKAYYFPSLDRQLSSSQKKVYWLSTTSLKQM